MPLIPGKLRDSFKKFQQQQQQQPLSLPSRTYTTSFLTPPPDNPLQPLQPVASSSTAPPPGSLILSFTHPDSARSQATAFFITCLPDTCTFAYYCALLIHRHLTPAQAQNRYIQWRHQSILIELEDKDGLAATSGGRIGISLKWVGNVMRDVQSGKRRIESAAQEFKGVVLHEMVHTIQHDGFGSSPGWFTESVADYIRLLAHLDPPHWKRAGQANRDRGWTTGYDVGAWFLCYLTGQEPPKVPYTGPDSFIPTKDVSPSTGTSAGPGGPQPTRISNEPGPPVPSGPRNGRLRRRGPFPGLVHVMDTRLQSTRWSDSWWMEMTGAPLEVLWQEYLDYYS